jgi:serine/threonine protein phosphatase PrpC
MSFTVEVAGKTDVGCVRKNNEDNLGWDQRVGLYVVCDGMGGALAGEVASKMGVDLLLDYFRQAKQTGMHPDYGNLPPQASPRARALSSAIQRANRAIFDSGQAKQTQRGMGSTIVAVLLEDGHMTVGHVGDSRVYLLRDGKMQQLTQDHSLVMEQVRRGIITREQAETSDMQNIIIRALGSEESVDPDVEELTVLRGDTLLLATDGLTKLVREDAMKQILETSSSLGTACELLIDAAKKKGGDDNITCVLLHISEGPWYRRRGLGKILPGGEPSWRNSF